MFRGQARQFAFEFTQPRKPPVADQRQDRAARFVDDAACLLSQIAALSRLSAFEDNRRTIAGRAPNERRRGAARVR